MVGNILSWKEYSYTFIWLTFSNLFWRDPAHSGVYLVYSSIGKQITVFPQPVVLCNTHCVQWSNCFTANNLYWSFIGWQGKQYLSSTIIITVIWWSQRNPGVNIPSILISVNLHIVYTPLQLTHPTSFVRPELDCSTIWLTAGTVWRVSLCWMMFHLPHLTFSWVSHSCTHNNIKISV